MSARIVIIGGMGPQASLELHRRIIAGAASAGARDNEDYPDIVHFSIPVPDFISSGDSSAGLRRIAESLEGMEFRKSDRVVVACNTAHILLPELEQLARVQIISVIDAVVDVVSREGYRRVGLLSTPTTIRSGLYQKRLAASAIECLLPSAAEEQQVEEAIRAVIDSTAEPQHAARLRTITSRVVAEGAEAIILGCTELPLIFPRSEVRVPVFDCLNVVADRLLS